MKREDLHRLHALADAKYKARQQLFQSLVQRENAIRADLHQLDEQARASNKNSDPSMRSIGADVIWKAWLGKAKTSLNMKLALVLAEKDQHVRQVRQAYGKVLASEGLLQEVSEDERRKRRNRELEKAIETTLPSVNRSDL
ncbi:hypothetical protein [uncultured Roseobacter sp.]|uniref:hypothetical protein n=1 Tax=uncultured Roseobacter sp. TaxID=114847 RepID=UPI00261933F3|nr:hypothetical protein [uncultured Roseobacter sp.]